jgi:hypothetical protein
MMLKNQHCVNSSLLASIVALIYHLRHARVTRYSRDADDDENPPALISWDEVRDRVGGETVKLLATYFYHTDFAGRPAAERRVLAERLELLASQLPP